MKVERIELRIIEIPLKKPFEIASHRFETKTALVLKAWATNGLTGWAEGEHLATPWYVPETVEAGWALLSSVLIPGLLRRSTGSAEEIGQHFAWIQGNQLSLAAVDGLVCDLLAKEKGVSLSTYLGGVRTSVPAGASLGLCSTPAELSDRVAEAASAGYLRVKIKIKPGKDIAYLERVRRDFPDLPIMVDANSSYTPLDADRLKELDRFRLMMIEQPYENGDLVHHAGLAARLTTPICLDESVHNLHEARSAAALRAGKILNIKPPRVGGITAVQKMLAFAREAGLSAWCGGMLETGLGRAVNIACASLKGFDLPGDLAAPATYLTRDLVAEEFALSADGTIPVLEGAGIGVSVDEDYLEHCTTRLAVFA